MGPVGLLALSGVSGNRQSPEDHYRQDAGREEHQGGELGRHREAEYEAGQLLAVLQRGNERLDAEAAERRQRYMEITGMDFPEGFDPGENTLARLQESGRSVC